MDDFDVIEARSYAYRAIGERARFLGKCSVCLLGEHGGTMRYTLKAGDESREGTIHHDDPDTWASIIIGQMLVDQKLADLEYVNGVLCWAYECATGSISVPPERKLN